MPRPRGGSRKQSPQLGILSYSTIGCFLGTFAGLDAPRGLRANHRHQNPSPSSSKHESDRLITGRYSTLNPKLSGAKTALVGCVMARVVLQRTRRRGDMLRGNTVKQLYQTSRPRGLKASHLMATRTKKH